MTSKNFRECCSEPEAVFGKPRDVLAEKNFTNDQKQRILRNWKDEMNVLVRADSEDDSPQKVLETAQAALCIQAINDALYVLKIHESHRSF